MCLRFSLSIMLALLVTGGGVASHAQTPQQPISKTYILSQAICLTPAPDPPALLPGGCVPQVVPADSIIEIQLPGGRSKWEVLSLSVGLLQRLDATILPSPGRIVGTDSIYRFRFRLVKPGLATITFKETPANLSAPKGEVTFTILGVDYILNTTAQQPNANFNISGDGTAGGTLSGNTVNATTQFNLGGQRILGNAGLDNLFAGVGAGAANTSGGFNSFVGARAGQNVTTGNGNVFIGGETGSNNVTGSSNTAIGSGANVGSDGLFFATAIGSLATVASSNTIALGRSNGMDRVITPGGIVLNDSAIQIRGASDTNHRIVYDRTIDGTGFHSFSGFRWLYNGTGSEQERMRLENNGNLTIAGRLAQSSDARFKTAVQRLPQALDRVLRLRGVTYQWQPELHRDPRPQIGFIAQEVEAVLPELVSTDEEGFKSVAYANAVPVLVEAIKEQQQQIAELKDLKTKLERQQQQIAELKAQLAALAAQLPQPKAAGQR